MKLNREHLGRKFRTPTLSEVEVEAVAFLSKDRDRRHAKLATDKRKKDRWSSLDKFN